MVIKCLVENTTLRDDIVAEHGLSLYLEVGKRKLLFDMGQTDLILKNAETMGVDLSAVDTVVLSHGHYDHGGGMGAFRSVNSKAKIYISKFAQGRYYNGTEKYIGLDEKKIDPERTVLVGDRLDLGDGMEIVSCNSRSLLRPINPYGLNKVVDGKFVPDDFLHEQYLLIKENGKNILISGCSHKGIINIENWFTPDILVGGFHLMKVDPESDAGKSELEFVAEKLNSYKTRYFTCHCTGVPQYEYLKNFMVDNLNYLHAGQEIIL